MNHVGRVIMYAQMGLESGEKSENGEQKRTYTLETREDEVLQDIFRGGRPEQ